MSDRFEAHSWVLANWNVGGHTAVDNPTMLYITPLRFHRRQLHTLQYAKGGERRPYAGTLSMGTKRGAWVKHSKYGLCYVGGTSKGRISLHAIDSGQRLCQNAKPEDCAILTTASRRIRKENGASSPRLKAGVSAPEFG